MFMAVAPLFLKKTHFPSAGKPCKSDVAQHNWSSKSASYSDGASNKLPQLSYFAAFYNLWRWANAVGGHVASLRNTAETVVLAFHQPGEPCELPPGCISSHKDSPESHLTGEWTQSGYIQSGLHRRASQHLWQSSSWGEKLKWTNTPQNLMHSQSVKAIHSQPVKSTVINPNKLNVSYLEPLLYDTEAKSPWEVECPPILPPKTLFASLWGWGWLQSLWVQCSIPSKIKFLQATKYFLRHNQRILEMAFLVFTCDTIIQMEP